VVISALTSAAVSIHLTGEIIAVASQYIMRIIPVIVLSIDRALMPRVTLGEGMR